MKLISCEKCGIVIKTERLDLPNFDIDDEEAYNEHMGYNNGQFETVFYCPVCGSKITHSKGEFIA